jgi:hypothetical protein
MKMDAQYDLIIGMDVMQVIGLDLLNSSKAIVWKAIKCPLSLMTSKDQVIPTSLSWIYACNTAPSN